jgi:hypothetical protein
MKIRRTRLLRTPWIKWSVRVTGSWSNGHDLTEGEGGSPRVPTIARVEVCALKSIAGEVPVASGRRQYHEGLQEGTTNSNAGTSTSIASRGDEEGRLERRRSAGTFWTRDGTASARRERARSFFWGVQGGETTRVARPTSLRRWDGLAISRRSFGRRTVISGSRSIWS